MWFYQAVISETSREYAEDFRLFSFAVVFAFVCTFILLAANLNISLTKELTTDTSTAVLRYSQMDSFAEDDRQTTAHSTRW